MKVRLCEVFQDWYKVPDDNKTVLRQIRAVSNLWYSWWHCWAPQHYHTSWFAWWSPWLEWPGKIDHHENFDRFAEAYPRCSRETSKAPTWVRPAFRRGAFGTWRCCITCLAILSSFGWNSSPRSTLTSMKKWRDRSWEVSAYTGRKL